MLCLLAAPGGFLGGGGVDPGGPSSDGESGPDSGGEGTPSPPPIQLPPTPPAFEGDRPLDSPLKGYRRVFVKAGAKWTLQFVSPDGLRFDSQDELALHVCRKRSDLDPDDLKKLDLHFLKETLDDEPRESSLSPTGSHPSKVVPLTFCNMRQNILDLKRKRGYKRTMSKEPKRSDVVTAMTESSDDADEASRSSTDAPDLALESAFPKVHSPHPPSEDTPTIQSENNLVQPDIAPERDTLNQPMFREDREDRQPDCQTVTSPDHVPVDDPEEKAATPASEPILTVESSDEDVTCSAEERVDVPKMIKARRPSSLSSSSRGEVLPSLQEEEEVQIITKEEFGVTDDRSADGPLIKDCQVEVLDLFGPTPLNHFQCLSCHSRYCTSHDDFTVDLQCQILSVVCGNCLWWTHRRISTRLKPV